MEYKVVVGDSPGELTRIVKEFMMEKWKPVGSHQVVIRKGQNRFSGTQHMDTINQLEYSQTLIRE